MNKITLTGRLTKAPELSQTSGGTQYVDINVVWNDEATKARTEEDLAEFYRFRFWGNTANFINNYATKGTKVLVSGDLSLYKDRNEVLRHQYNGTHFEILSQPQANDTSEYQKENQDYINKSKAKREKAQVEVEEDDLPF